MFVELTLTDGRGYVLVDLNKVTAVCKANGITEVYLVGSNDAHFRVVEDAKDIIHEIKKI